MQSTIYYLENVFILAQIDTIQVQRKKWIQKRV